MRLTLPNKFKRKLKIEKTGLIKKISVWHKHLTVDLIQLQIIKTKSIAIKFGLQQEDHQL